MTHSGEKPFSCTQCDYSCREASKLKIHLRTHSGEKPFKCDQCDYSCAQSGTLKRHRRTHTGEEPYTCNQCRFSSKQSGNLQQHMARKHREQPNVWEQQNITQDFFCNSFDFFYFKSPTLFSNWFPQFRASLPKLPKSTLHFKFIKRGKNFNEPRSTTTTSATIQWSTSAQPVLAAKWTPIWAGPGLSTNSSQLILKVNKTQLKLSPKQLLFVKLAHSFETPSTLISLTIYWLKPRWKRGFPYNLQN